MGKYSTLESFTCTYAKHPRNVKPFYNNLHISRGGTDRQLVSLDRKGVILMWKKNFSDHGLQSMYLKCA